MLLLVMEGREMIWRKKGMQHETRFHFDIKHFPNMERLRKYNWIDKNRNAARRGSTRRCQRPIGIEDFSPKKILNIGRVFLLREMSHGRPVVFFNFFSMFFCLFHAFRAFSRRVVHITGLVRRSHRIQRHLRFVVA